jgi:hypothetical protein
MTKRYVNMLMLFILTFSCSGGYHWCLIKKTDDRQWNISAKFDFKQISGKSESFFNSCLRVLCYIFSGGRHLKFLIHISNVVTDNLIILCVQLGFNQKFLVSWKKCFLNNKIRFNNKACCCGYLAIVQ